MFSGNAISSPARQNHFWAGISKELSGFPRSGIELDQIGLIGLKLPILSSVALLGAGGVGSSWEADHFPCPPARSGVHLRPLGGIRKRHVPGPLGE